MLSTRVITNSTARMMPPISGNSSVKNTLRAESNHCLRKYHTHANAVMP